MSSSLVRPAISYQTNPVTRALREGRVCLGALSISFASPVVAEIFGAAGFHFYYIDMEHGQTGYDELAAICMASKLTGVVPIAGTTSVADHLIARPLDAGAMGVIVPHVETPEHAAMAVRYSKYPPQGKRGVLTAGVHTEFAEPDAGDLTAGQNREILTAVKVESGLGIENIDEIAATPGLDAILMSAAPTCQPLWAFRVRFIIPTSGTRSSACSPRSSATALPAARTSARSTNRSSGPTRARPS